MDMMGALEGRMMQWKEHEREREEVGREHEREREEIDDNEC